MKTTTAPHLHMATEIETTIEQLSRLASHARENATLVAKLVSNKQNAALLQAEKRVAELEDELKTATATIAELRQRIEGQSASLHDVRIALNGKGRNPIANHAHAVFQALSAVVPDHPLVRRKPGDAPEKAALSQTDLRFIYSLLSFASCRLSDMGCSDWCIEDPDEATLNFMQLVENFSARNDPTADGPETLCANEDGDVFGPANFMVADYLMQLLREVYGSEIFDNEYEF